MKYKSPTYIRKGKKLYPADPTSGLPSYNMVSIGAAKRESTILQKANGGLGCGYVRVAKGN